MNKTVAEAAGPGRTASSASWRTGTKVDIVLCPPFTALAGGRARRSRTRRSTSARRTCTAEKSGAFTGEIAADMLRELGCHYVILGHSERRAVLQGDRRDRQQEGQGRAGRGPAPDRLRRRDAGASARRARRRRSSSTQVRGSLAGLSANDLLKTVVAYEPVWAIGTGKTATPAQAQEVHAFIRKVLTEHARTRRVAQSVRIQYGGSVKPSNAKELFHQPDIDGGLIGGASLEARSFVDIVKGAL